MIEIRSKIDVMKPPDYFNSERMKMTEIETLTLKITLCYIIIIIFNSLMASLLEFEIVNRPKSFLIPRFNSQNNTNYAKWLKKSMLEDLQKQGISAINHDKITQNDETDITFSAKLFLDIQILFRVKIDSHKDQIDISTFLAQGSHFVSPKSTQVFKSVCKTINKFNQMARRSLAYFAIHPHNGQLKVKLQCNSMLVDETKFGLVQLKMLICEAVFLSKQLGPSLLYSINQLQPLQLKQILPQRLRPLYFSGNGQFHYIADLKQLILMANWSLEFENNSKKKNKVVFSQENARILIDFSYKQQIINQHQHALYINPPVYVPQRPVNRSINKEFFKILTFQPARQTVNENAFIFNTIKVDQDNKVKQKLIGQGGKARLVAIPFKYKYIFSANVVNSPIGNNFDDISQDNFSINSQAMERKQITIEKTLVVKMPINKHDVQGLQNIIYQKDILSNFRGTTSVYLPKYYHSIQSNFIYSEFLLMDYVHGYTLHQEMQLKKTTFGYHSAFQILSNVSNAIRFIEQKQVAHLDISPNNILIVKDLMIKLIDFGEAYCPNTINQYKTSQQKTGKIFKYAPGRTFPYAPPETSCRLQDFTNQQDIYSLGIICFKMVFGYLPFTCSQTKNEQWYKQKTYLNHIFFAPQQIQHLGQPDLMAVIIQLIFKMIHPQELMRPLPCWSYILFKKILHLLK